MSDTNQIPLFRSESIIAKYNIEPRLESYFDEILEYNKKVNIVSRDTSRPERLKMAADSLIPFEFIPPPAGRFFDIGSGGGFPSIVILLAFPGLKASLFERTGKKAAFLRDIIGSFDLDAEIIPVNFAEAFPGLPKTSFDFGTMKLVRPDKNIIRGVSRLLKPDGSFLYYARAEHLAKEIPDLKDAAFHSYYLDDIKQLRGLTIISSHN